MGRPPCCDKNGLKKGPWTPEEDRILTDYIHRHGYGNWRTLPKNAGLQRCGKSCRLRWTNYLRPDIKRGRFSFEEEESIIQLHSILGNKWSAIAARLPGRTDNEIKNYWNTHVRKRLLRMGIDPVTHIPRLDLSSILANPNLLRLFSSGHQQNRPTAAVHHRQETQSFNNQIYQNSIFGNQISDQQYYQNHENYVPTPADNYFYYNSDNNIDDSDQPIMDNLILNYSTDNNFDAEATTYVNGCGAEDEREIINYCNNYDVLKFEIPEILEVSDFTANF